MALIRKDKHSLYVKNGGYIARPVRTERTRGNSITTESRYEVGEKIKAKHLGGTSFQTVGDETWCNHGCYYDFDTGGERKSNDCWEPLCVGS